MGRTCGEPNEIKKTMPTRQMLPLFLMATHRRCPWCRLGCEAVQPHRELLLAPTRQGLAGVPGARLVRGLHHVPSQQVGIHLHTSAFLEGLGSLGVHVHVSALLEGLWPRGAHVHTSALFWKASDCAPRVWPGGTHVFHHSRVAVTSITFARLPLLRAHVWALSNGRRVGEIKINYPHALFCRPFIIY